jgi:DNA-binding HxlR family transcriptional regulator
MSTEGYNNFCPIAKACEVLEPRWTMLILCEMWFGSQRFNDIRRGVLGMSPTLLSKRLKEMQQRGLITRAVDKVSGEITYQTTPITEDLRPIVEALGLWAHRNIDAAVTLEKLDARLLMWNMRRRIDCSVLPAGRRTVVQITYPELPEDQRCYWLIARPGAAVDLCSVEPGFEVDLYITADLRAMTAAWMGHSTLAAEITRGKIVLDGSTFLIRSIERWMVRSMYATAPCEAGPRRARTGT